MTPLVSILLPMRDAAATLEPALASVARQTLREWECVVVDDGSRDEGLEIARRFAERDPRYRIVAGERRGLVASLNEGLALCRAPWVARMDADDWMHRDRLAAQRSWLEAHPELEAVGCRVRLFPRRGLTQGRRAYARWLDSLDDATAIHRDRFVECPLPHPTWMVRRETLAGLGYRDLGWPEDYDLMLRLLARGPCVGSVPRRLLGWRDRPDRLSRTDPRYGLDRFTACRAHHLSRDFLCDPRDPDARRPFVLWGHGSTGRALRRTLVGLGHRLEAIIEVHPRRIGNRIHGAPVLPPAALEDRTLGPIVVSVAGARPRGEIRSRLAASGRREGIDFVCAA